ncbi:MAG: hypothetical protein CSA32_03210 [Desulfobulbus propionicus]|nr:MAG: hypothetical protein CSA32_03210 [Desulfobulbus propionicus]
MHIVLHTCCGPCSVYPVEQLQKYGHTITGYFYNPNIHPFREFRKRIAALRQLADTANFQVTIEADYGLKDFLRQVVFYENDRCVKCYDMRLETTALYAVKIGADAFTTTLLYSKYQKHEIIRKKCEYFALKYNLYFHYQDFREGWQYGIDRSIEMDLYRQPYCGCIYSEQERYDKKMGKKRKKKEKVAIYHA